MTLKNSLCTGSTLISPRAMDRKGQGNVEPYAAVFTFTMTPAFAQRLTR